VLINPVVNIPANFYGSDIPDWAQVESGTWKTNPATSAVEELVKMYNASPLAHVHKVVAPTLLVLSTKDKRVPMLQSIHYYNELRSRGVTTKYATIHPLPPPPPPPMVDLCVCLAGKGPVVRGVAVLASCRTVRCTRNECVCGGGGDEAAPPLVCFAAWVAGLSLVGGCFTQF
jgi:hypothetical protein